EAQILDETSFQTYLNEGHVYFIGNGVEKAQTIIRHPNANFIENKLPSSKDMAQLAYDRYKKNDTEDVAYFEPYYLKEFIGFKS
ncbi:MAG: tRNA (adenosine(37)-N6)-threonylcarbamoyltransferase complex dimerization subunit type 1 TsaB, partial [Aquaticitalea sp.]